MLDQWHSGPTSLLGVNTLKVIWSSFLFHYFFGVDHFLLNLIQYRPCFVFCLALWLRDTWELRLLTGDWTRNPLLGRLSLNHWKAREVLISVQFSRSVVSDSLRPHEPQHSRPPCPSPTPGVHSNLVYWVGDAIQPSHPLLSPSPPAPSPSQHQGFFQWVSSSHQVAKVLEFQPQHQSFQWIFRTDFL